MELMIWTILGLLTYLVLHATVERLLFFVDYRLAEPADLQTLVLRCIGAGRLRIDDVEGRLGWLQGQIEAACRNRGGRKWPRGGRQGRNPRAECLGSEWAKNLYSNLHEMEAMTGRFLSTLPMARDVAMSMGLLGSVSTLIAMSGASHASSDPILSISLALVSTRWGLVIAIAVVLVQPWVRLEASRRLDQIAAVQEAIDRIRMKQIGEEEETYDVESPRSPLRRKAIPLLTIDGE